MIAVDVSPAMVRHLDAQFAGQPDVTVVPGGVPHVRTRRRARRVRVLPQRAAPAPRLLEGHRPPAHHPRTSRPAAIFRVRDLVFDFEPAEADEFIPAWMAGGVDDPARGWTPDELAEHVRIEFSTYRWLFEPMLERVGFEILDVDYVRRAYGAYTCRYPRST